VPAALKSVGSRVTRGKRIAVQKGFMEGGRRELGNSGLKSVPAILVLARATSALLDGSIGAPSVYRQEASTLRRHGCGFSDFPCYKNQCRSVCKRESCCGTTRAALASCVARLMARTLSWLNHGSQLAGANGRYLSHRIGHCVFHIRTYRYSAIMQSPLPGVDANSGFGTFP